MTKATLVYCVNVSAIYHHQHTMFVEMSIHFVCEKVALSQLHVIHTPSGCQIVDIFIKGLPLQLFDEFIIVKQFVNHQFLL